MMKNDGLCGQEMQVKGELVLSTDSRRLIAHPHEI